MTIVMWSTTNYQKWRNILSIVKMNLKANASEFIKQITKYNIASSIRPLLRMRIYFWRCVFRWWTAIFTSQRIKSDTWPQIDQSRVLELFTSHRYIKHESNKFNQFKMPETRNRRNASESETIRFFFFFLSHW